jgi:four helix bundle protein
MDYRDLVAWQKAMDLVEGIYVATAEFPREERYGLTSQIRRAAVSVPSNIAEGQGRRTSDDEFVRFLQIALGSLAELQTQLELAARLRFLDKERVIALRSSSDEVGRLLSGLVKSKRKSHL